MSDFTIERSQPQYDPYSPLQAMNTLAQGNNTVEQGQIANQSGLLQLQLQQARIRPVLSLLQGLQGQQSGGGDGGSSLAPAAANTTPLGTSPGGSSGVTSTPLAAPGAPQSASGMTNASYMTGGGSGGGVPVGQAPGGPPPGAPSGGDGSGGSALPPGPGDQSAGLIGVAVPVMALAGAMQGADPSGDISKLVDTRRQWLYSGAAQASTPQAWNSFVMSAYNNGWATSAQTSHLLNHFELQPRVMKAMASPDEAEKYAGESQGQGVTTDANGNPVSDPNMVAAKAANAQAQAYGESAGKLPLAAQLAAANAGGSAAGALPYVGPTAAAKAAATLPYDARLAQLNPYNLQPGESRVLPPLPPLPNLGGGGVPSAPVAGGASGGPPAAGPTAASLLTPAAPITGAAYAQSVNGNENGTGNPAALNASGPGGTPTSSAMGNGQFINATWLDLMQKNRPDLTAGKTQTQILAMRGVPAIASQMTEAYGQQNATILQGGGFPVNAASLGMAHMLGGGDAVKVLTADPNAPLSSVLSPAVLQANPSLAKETVGQFTIGMRNKYGLSPVQFGPQAGAQGGAGNAAPAATTAAPPAAPTSIPSAVAGGAPIPINRVAGPPLPASNTGSNVSTIPYGITPGPGQVNAPPVVQPAAAVSGPAPVVNPAVNAPVAQPAPAQVAPTAPQVSVASSVAYVAPKIPTGTPAAPAVPIVTQMPGGGTSVTSSLTPGAVEQQKADVTALTEYRNNLLQQSQAASQANSTIAQLRTPQFTQGEFSDEKAGLFKAVDGFMKTFGLPESDQMQQSLASYQDFNKNIGKLARQTASSISPRVGVQELEMVQNSLLTPETSSLGAKEVLNQMAGLNDFQMAKAGASAGYQGNPAGFESWWNQNISPTPFIINRIAQTDGPTGVSAMFAQMRAQPGGDAMAKQIAQEYENAKQNGLFSYATN